MLKRKLATVTAIMVRAVGWGRPDIRTREKFNVVTISAWKSFLERMVMQRLIGVIAVVLLSAGVAFGQPCPDGEWCQWTVGEGANDHWYRLVEQEETWEEANANADSRGGYLVTIMNANENAWLITQFASATSSNNALWTGFYQDTQDENFSEPDHGWKWFSDPAFCRWSTGYTKGNTDVCYTNWRAGEPNDSPVGNPPQHQNCTQWYTSQNGPSFSGTWDDQYCDRPIDFELKSILERETAPSVPTVSEWGLVVMALLLLTAGTVVLMRRRRSATTM